MKRLLLLFAAVLMLSSGFSQAACSVPLSNTSFQSEYGNISATVNATSKLNYAINMANTNCLSASQVKQTTMLFFADQDKLEFAKAAYRNTVDKENFYDVYDAFAYFSTVFRLHDYVIAQRGQNFNYNNVTTTVVADYPIYAYPDYTGYFGITGCNYPIDENSFYSTYTSYKLSKLAENAKVIAIKDFINANCLSTAQIMKLTSIVTFESSRLDILKSGYLRAYDRGNYGMADQLLPSTNYKLDFANFLKGNTTTTTIITTNNTCVVSSDEMKDIKNTINNSSFDNSKLTVAKQAISAKKCFTVNQIKEILGLFDFESSKLELAKYAYDYCIDKSNYYLVNDLFSFSSSKDDLTKYVQGK